MQNGGQQFNEADELEKKKSRILDALNKLLGPLITSNRGDHISGCWKSLHSPGTCFFSDPNNSWPGECHTGIFEKLSQLPYADGSAIWISCSIAAPTEKTSRVYKGKDGDKEIIVIYTALLESITGKKENPTAKVLALPSPDEVLGLTGGKPSSLDRLMHRSLSVLIAHEVLGTVFGDSGMGLPVIYIMLLDLIWSSSLISSASQRTRTMPLAVTKTFDVWHMSQSRDEPTWHCLE